MGIMLNACESTQWCLPPRQRFHAVQETWAACLEAKLWHSKTHPGLGEWGEQGGQVPFYCQYCPAMQIIHGYSMYIQYIYIHTCMYVYHSTARLFVWESTYQHMQVEHRSLQTCPYICWSLKSMDVMHVRFPNSLTARFAWPKYIKNIQTCV
jgi:hypothetical protein